MKKRNVFGSRSSSTDIYPSEKPIKLANKKVYALGTWFSTVNEHMQINFSDRFEKMKNILNSWSARRLTLLGKIAIIKSLAISQIVYALSSLLTPKCLLKEINYLLYEFLWDGKGDKIKRTQIINKYDEGGLKMIDIESFSKALKAKWVVNYLNGDTHGKWKLFFYYYLQKHGGKALFQGNLNSEDVPLLKLHNAFIEEIVQIWSHINYTADEEQDFGNSCIWYNSLIRIDHRPFFYKSWFDAGVKQAKDLMDTNGAFLTYNAFCLNTESRQIFSATIVL